MVDPSAASSSGPREGVGSVVGGRGPQFVYTNPSVRHIPHREREAEATIGTAAENSHSMRIEL